MKSSTLLALTASALALPGLSHQAKADAPPAAATLSYRISGYQEDKLDQAKILVGSSDRYDITVHQLQWVAPVSDNYSLSLGGSRESMSGASPWYTLNLPGSGVKVIMSGATIHEERTDFTAAGRRYFDNGSIGLSAGYSDENDYRSFSGGLEGERHFNDNLTTLAAGVSFSSDDLNPADAAKFNRITEASKQSRSLYVALTQVVNQNALVQTGLSYTHLSGYLSDPYKLFDHRPDTRSEWAWTTAWRQFMPAANAALHADYRYYRDSFGIDSHTLQLEWYQNLGKKWQVVPGVRVYRQSAADFFHAASVFTPGVTTSSDYRLSAYGAVSGTLKLQVELDKFTFSLSGERYLAGTGLALRGGEQSPALVNFTRLSLGVDYRY